MDGIRIQCACGKPDCRVSIYVDDMSERLWVTGEDGQTTVVYLNPASLQVLMEYLSKIAHYRLTQE